MARAKGARPSHPDKLSRTKPAASHAVVAAVLSLAFSAPQTEKHPVNFLPECEDQGQSSACTSHALSVGVAATCGGKLLPFVPSPLHFYSCSGGIERAAANPVGQLPALADNGRQLADNIAALMTCGAVAMKSPTPDGRVSDVWSAVDVSGLPSPPPANVTAEPSIHALEASALDCLSGAHTQDLTAANALDVCAAALDGGISLYIGFDCGQTFEDLGATGIAQPTPASDPNQGGHALVVVSYRINAVGDREWLIRNSWGNGWALSGGAWCSSAWLLACWELWLLDDTLMTGAA